MPSIGRAPTRRVLVVEDEPSVREAIASYLADSGYIVEQAGDGLEALHRMRQSLPDLVLLDLELPVMRGPSFVQAVRTEPHLAAAPIVVLSGSSELTSVASELGVRAALAKPIDMDVLLAVVNRLSRC
jgi:CheY-like chemotaxis protein